MPPYPFRVLPYQVSKHGFRSFQAFLAAIPSVPVNDNVSSLLKSGSSRAVYPFSDCAFTSAVCCRRTLTTSTYLTKNAKKQDSPLNH